jgi:hypothetical protein
MFNIFQDIAKEKRQMGPANLENSEDLILVAQAFQPARAAFLKQRFGGLAV